MMLYELDEIERGVLLGTQPKSYEGALAKMNPRPGERVQTWWCEECQEEHTGSVLGGLIGDPHGEAK